MNALYLAAFRLRIFHPEGVRSHTFHNLGLQGPVSAVGGSFSDPVYNLHALRHFTEGSIASVQMGRAPVHDEKLGARGIRMHGAGHGQDSGCVFQVIFDAVSGKFALDVITGAAHAASFGTAALDHESIDDPVEDKAVVEFLVYQADEIVHGNGSGLRVQFKTDYFPAFHGDGDNRIFFHNRYPFCLK